MGKTGRRIGSWLSSSTAEEAIAQEGEPRRYGKGRRKERGDRSSSRSWIDNVGWIEVEGEEVGFLRASQGLGLNWRSSPSEGRWDATIVVSAYLIKLFWRFVTMFSRQLSSLVVLSKWLFYNHACLLWIHMQGPSFASPTRF